jgi:hypothetical protein
VIGTVDKNGPDEDEDERKRKRNKKAILAVFTDSCGDAPAVVAMVAAGGTPHDDGIRYTIFDDSVFSSKWPP